MVDDDAFAALVLRFLDGATTPDENATLNAELKAPQNDARRDLYVDLCRQRASLNESFARRVTKLPGRFVTRRSLWVAAAAAVVVVALGLSWLLSTNEFIAIAVVDSVQGAVATDRGRELKAGDGLQMGEGLTVPAAGRAVFHFTDGTRVEAFEKTALRRFEVGGGIRFHLDSGRLRAEVSVQLPNAPLIVRTPDGEAKVLGTILSLAVTRGSTRLEVEKGKVRLTRLSDRAAADVSAGQFAVASATEPPTARPLKASPLEGLAPNSWRAVPGTAMLQVAPPKSDSIWGRMGPDAVVAAWSGGAFDTKRNRLVLWGGGHTDYYGNEVYAFNVDSLRWERLTDPCPNPKLSAEFNDDGTPNGRATYNGLAYLTATHQLFSFSGSVVGNGFASCKSTMAFDLDAKTWRNLGAAGTPSPLCLGSTCAYDPVTRQVWWGQSPGMYSFDPGANRWTKHSDDEFYYLTSAVDPKRGLWIVVGNGNVFAVDVRSGAPVRQTWKTTGGDAFIKKGNVGLDYDPVRDRIVGWAGGAVYSLDLETKVWTAVDAPGAPAPTPNGIYGRWRYVPGVDAFVVVTSASEDVRFFKPGR